MMENRRSTIVINKKFQYQHSLFAAALAVILLNLFILFAALYPSEHTLELRPSMTLTLAAIEIMLLSLIWYGGLLVSHRIAGPIYVITREVSKLGEGDLTSRISLRDKDMFHDEAAQINAGLAALNQRLDEARTLCEDMERVRGDSAAEIEIATQLSEKILTLTTRKGA
ncbi:MAG: hypothetical protein ABJN62_03590 [Halioglobus sp.]